MKITTVAQSRP